MAAKPHLQSGESSSNWKSSTNITQPKFFKIILSQHERSRLRIPEDFASIYCKNMLNPVYLEVPSGEVWEVEVVHSQGQICLGIGWQDFSDFYSISRGHFLMFGYNARSHFNVSIFDLSASEIEYPYSSAHGIHTPIFHCHETRHAPKRDQSESDDSVEILEGIPRSQKAKAIIPDTIEHSVENLGHCPLGQSSKRKRKEGDTENDVSVDMHIKRMEVEKSQENVASPSFTREGKKSNKGCRMQKQQSESVYGPNKAVMDRKSAVAYQRAKAFKSKNPFMTSFMQPSYVFSPFSLSIALKFARKYFLENYGNLVLRVPGRGRGSWSVKCTTRGTNAKVHSGWKAFVLDNKLKCGDVCVFEVIKGTRLFIDVTIFRAAGSTLMHKIIGEVPGDSDSKSNVFKTDNCVPCSQPKVVHTKKLKQRKGEEHGEGTEIEHSVEILGHCPLAHGSKRKRPEGEAEGNVSIDIHTKSINVENTQEHAASPSITRKTKRSGESCRMHKQQSEVVYAKNKTVDKERSIAYQRAKAFTSENPFVIYFMQPSYVSKPYSLHISLLFAVKYFRENCGNLVLRVPGSGSGSWPVKYALGKSKPKICFSWKAFVLDNKLKFGDACVFELIKGGTKPILDVTIFRAAESKPMHKIDAKLAGVSDSKKKTIKTENSVPCSQPKIVHSRKLNFEKKQRGDSDCFTSKIKEEPSEAAGKHVQQSKSSCKGSAVAKEMVLAYLRAKAFTSENPFFTCFMQPSYVSSASGPMQLSITLSRARKFFAAKHSDVVLQNSSKRSWAVKCSLGTVNAKLTSGWKEFVLDNNLKVGDVCVFERVSRSKLLFNVIIYTSAEGM
ncbi:B3 domain-containing protein_Os12g40080-like isoform X3 [Nicotiana tomentosiformis]|uniref:B3 domain-containing protein_Os12g40080-like isoform X3 n=1 Tax=Nicotiana tomentosiformis TaxID=4098 RepID=UPI00051AEEF5|nr:putative B3 domain-containing protein Os03g0621600 isoform X1 [Nicotiana tomentosiformis]